MNNKIEKDDAPLKILDIKIMQGANYFSGGNVAVMLLDLGKYDEVFTNQIPGFYIKLSSLLPSLIEHHCSVGKRGGFFLRVKEGTLLGHVTEHIAIELQTLAGMNVGFGKTRRTTKKGIYNVVIRYLYKEAGIYALKFAVKIINAILSDTPIKIEPMIKTLIDIRERSLFGPSTQAIVDEAKKRKIPFFRLDEYNLVQLGTGKYLKQIRATLTSETNFIAVDMADDKYLTNSMLSDAGLPVPETYIYKKEKEIHFEKFVIKPRYGNLGRGISIIENRKDYTKEIERAKAYSDDVLIQKFIEGKTYRILTIDYKVVAATRIDPPKIKGDGKHTVGELIEILNSNPHRGIGDKTPLTEMKIDEETLYLLNSKRLNLDSVLEKNRELALKISPNLKLGGTSIDVSQSVHPDNIFAAERAARFIGLNVAGIDFVLPDIRKSVFKTNGAIIEVNAAPDFRMHLMPMAGMGRNPAKPLLDMLFKENKPSHIPLISVTGTFGKNKAVKFISKTLELKGLKVGSYYENTMNINGFTFNNINPFNAVRNLLKDPTIDVAVTKIPLQTILNDGLPYQYSDFGVVLNVKGKYENLDSYVYIRDMDDVAYAKSVVAEQVRDNGITILNADDELVYEMRKRIRSDLILFSQKYSEIVKKCIEKGNKVVFIKDDKVVIYSGKKTLEIDFPVNKLDDSTRDSLLASIAVLLSLKIEIALIKKVLKDFF